MATNSSSRKTKRNIKMKPDADLIKNADSKTTSLHKNVVALNRKLDNIIRDNRRLQDRILTLENRAGFIERSVNQLNSVIDRFSRMFR